MIHSQSLRSLKLHMGFDNLCSSVIFSSNSSGVVDWWITGLNRRLWCIDGRELTPDGARLQLGHRLRLQRRCSVREEVPECEEINICLLQHQNEICFPCRRVTELIKPDTRTTRLLYTKWNRAYFCRSPMLLYCAGQILGVPSNRKEF